MSSFAATTSKGNILLVDDTSANLHLLTRILSDEGYTVRPAPNGALALRSVESSLPDLILLDVKMPGMSGYNVCQSLKEKEQTRSIPVIFISALGDILDKVKAFALGGVDYITKPFQPEEVIIRVNTQFNILQLQRELLQQNQRLQQEIQERMTTEQALQDSEETFSKAFSASPNPITITLLSTGQHLEVNDAFLRQTGYSRQEVIGKTALELNLWVHLEERLKLFQHLQENRDIHNFEFTSRRKDGLHRTALLSSEQITLRGQRCLLSFSNDITERKRKEEALRLIVEGTASTTGKECFRSCVRYLAKILEVRYAGVTQRVDDNTQKMRTLALWTGETWSENIEYDLVGTPCENVLQGQYCYYPDRLQEYFPDDQILIDLNIVSYCGIPLVNTSNEIVGALIAFDDKPMKEDVVRELILRIFSARITAEIQRSIVEEELVKKSKDLAQFSKSLKELHRLSLSNHQNFDDLFNDYLETGCQILGFSDGIVGKVRNDQFITQIIKSEIKDIVPGLSLPLESTYCGEIIKRRRTLTYSHVGQDEYLSCHPIYQTYKIESYIGTPIIVNEEIYGSLSFFSCEPRDQGFEAYEKEIIELMAQSLAKVINAHQINERRAIAEAELIKKSKALADFSISLKQLHRLNLTHYHSFDTLFNDYLKAGCQVLNFTAGSVGLIEENVYKFVAVEIHEETLKCIVPNLTVELKDSYCGLVAQNKETMAFAEVGKIPDMQCHPLYLNLKLESYLGTPIWVNGQIYGTICFFSTLVRPQGFASHEKEIVELMAQSLSKVITTHLIDKQRQQTQNALVESEKRYAIATSESLVGVWDWNVETGEIYLSSNLKAMLGYKDEEILNHIDSWHLLVHPDDREANREAADTHLRELTSVYECEHRMLHKNGSIHWVLVRGTAFRDENGMPYRMMGTDTDITELKQAEVNLQRRERYLSTLVEVQSQLLQAKNLQDCYGEILELLGLASGASRVYVFENHRNAKGQLFMSQRAEWCSPGVREEIDNPTLQCLSYEESFPRWERVLSQGEIIEGVVADFPESERDILEPQGIISLLVFPLLCDGEFFGFFGFDNCDNARSWESSEIDLLKAAATAISLWQERKSAEIALEKAKEVAEIANRTKSQFLASMSHELRTPLNAILGFTQLLSKEHYLEQKGNEFLEIISRSGEHLLNLINDVLDMSKIEAGRITLEITSFDLYRLLNTIKDMFYLKAQKKGLRLFVRWSENVPQYIQTDESKLRQVLINLLGNAIKFTEKGHIGLIVNFAEGLLSFVVEDSGIGIALEDLDSIFEPFVQKQYNGNKVQEGTGLGLPISRQFVRLLGGELNVASRSQQGSLFSFQIPITLAQANDCMVDFSGQKITQLAPEQPKYRILIVEDQWTNRRLLRNIIEPLGFEVREAVNGQEAIKLWQSWQPHLIWMDMRMPISNGYEATREIRMRERNTHQTPCKIIALTASAFKETKEKLLANGCDDFVAKPFKEETLLEKMVEHLGVQYTYEVKLPKTQQTELSFLLADEITPTFLQTIMPQTWIERLHAAVIKGFDEAILELVAEIPDTHQSLKNTFVNWTTHYRFDKLVEATDLQATKPYLSNSR